MTRSTPTATHRSQHDANSSVTRCRHNNRHQLAAQETAPTRHLPQHFLPTGIDPDTPLLREGCKRPINRPITPHTGDNQQKMKAMQTTTKPGWRGAQDTPNNPSAPPPRIRSFTLLQLKHGANQPQVHPNRRKSTPAFSHRPAPSATLSTTSTSPQGVNRHTWFKTSLHRRMRAGCNTRPPPAPVSSHLCVNMTPSMWCGPTPWMSVRQSTTGLLGRTSVSMSFSPSSPLTMLSLRSSFPLRSLLNGSYSIGQKWKKEKRNKEGVVVGGSWCSCFASSG